MRIRTFRIDLGKNVFHLAPEYSIGGRSRILHGWVANFSGGLGHEFCVARTRILQEGQIANSAWCAVMDLAWRRGD